MSSALYQNSFSMVLHLLKAGKKKPTIGPLDINVGEDHKR